MPLNGLFLYYVVPALTHLSLVSHTTYILKLFLSVYLGITYNLNAYDVNAYLAARNLKDGVYTIYAEYSNYPKVKRIPTGVKVHQKYWDKVNKKVKANGAVNVKKSNDDMAAVLKNLNDAISDLYKANGNVLPTVAQLNDHFSQTAEAAAAAVPETPLTTVLSDYLENRTGWADSTRVNFRTLLSNIQAYEKANRITWRLSTLTNEEINRFQHFILKEFNLMNSTAAKRNRLLKHFLTEFPAANVIREKVKPLHKQLLSQPVILEKDEIQALINLPLSKDSRLGKVRNMQVLQIFTGLRYGDLIRLQPHHVRDKEITIREEKTNQIRRIPLFPQAAAVLNLYTSSETEDFELPCISIQKFNKYIAEIAASLDCLQEKVLVTTMVRDKVVETWEPKHEHIKSHSSRRTFCSLLLSMGYSIPETMTLSGHRSLTSFQRYMGKTQSRVDAVVDFAARWEKLT
jgi:integrase